MNCPKCNAVVSENKKFCTNCGAKLEKAEESAPAVTPGAVCVRCGAPIDSGARFCAECGADQSVQTGSDMPQPVYAEQASSASSEYSMSGQPQPAQAPPPVSIQQAFPQPVSAKRGGLVFAVIGILLLLTVLAVGGYDLVKTGEFKEDIAAFEKVKEEIDGLGKFEGEYGDLLDDADGAASYFQFWKYGDLSGSMEELADEIRRMNKAVAKYREQYEEIVGQIETEGRYVMDDYEDTYQGVKSDLEEALSDFDEKESKKKAEAFADIRDEIVEGNDRRASACIDDARNIQASFGGYDAHPFELYMVGDFVNRIEADKTEKDFIKLDEDYLQLKEWADKFYVAVQSGEQVGSFVQADVSEADIVRLYLSLYNYDWYNFKLEDFIVYEENGGQWAECEPVDIEQIKGSLTMDLVVDVSSSMQGDFYTMQDSVQGFVNSTHSDTALGLSTIGSIYERYHEFTFDKGSIIDSVWGLDCYGLTSLYQSLYSSVIYTASAEGARCVVAFTDGHNEPYGSGYDYDAQDVIDVSNYYQVPVYIIGIGSGVYSSELRNIAESTGGAYYDRVSIYDLQSIYSNIYETQGRLYELSYITAVPNNVNRDIYVLYADDTADLSVRLESELNAEALQEAYETSSYSADDLTSFYTDSKYLSSDDLSKLGADLEAVQTVINIYYAANGYQFGDGENGQKQLAKMISMGVISGNGTLNGDEVSAIMKTDPVIYHNFSALYNYRYELVYAAAYDIYWDNPSISYEELRSQVHRYFGEENETRFDPVTKAAWNAIKAG